MPRSKRSRASRKKNAGHQGEPATAESHNGTDSTSPTVASTHSGNDIASSFNTSAGGDGDRRGTVGGSAGSGGSGSGGGDGGGSHGRVRRRASQEKQTKHMQSGSGAAKLLVDEDPQKKWRSFYTRTIYTLAMIGGFFLVVFVGRQPCTALLVFFLQAMMYMELVKLMFQYQREQEMPNFRRLYYYWFLVCAYFVYGRTLMVHFEQHEFDHFLGFYVEEKGFLLRHHTFISFFLYVAGFMGFVFSLKKKKHYKYQFTQFAYCHIALLIVVGQSTFLVYNMFQGMIWFFLPCSLVICNDVFAYIFGFFFGKNRLIPQLSPKKTWEGFLGAFATTLLFAFVWSRICSLSHLMVCPQLGFRYTFQDCEPGELYVPVPLGEMPAFRKSTGALVTAVTQVQEHAPVAAIADLVGAALLPVAQAVGLTAVGEAAAAGNLTLYLNESSVGGWGNEMSLGASSSPSPSPSSSSPSSNVSSHSEASEAASPSNALSFSLGEAFLHLRVSPIQLHSLVLATFASIAAPFGGFFASGFKRAFKIKDFGDSIPGHGGVTDRMDCQIIMGMFAYVYFTNVVQPWDKLQDVLKMVGRLSPEEQMVVLETIRDSLRGTGLLPL